MTVFSRHGILIPLFCILCFAAGCGRSSQNEAPAPFSALTWESTPEDMRTTEGDPTEDYVSVYNGNTYVYSREYQGRNGTLKYMFDAEEQLMCIAWAYEASDADDLDEVYRILHSEVEDAWGKSGYNPAGATNYGDVWYRPEGDIIISAVTAGEQYAMQYAYLNPLVSNQDANK